MIEHCAVCGLPIAIGEFPCITTVRPHGRVQPRGGFEPHFDIGLGQYVTGWGDVRKAMREHHLDFRDHPSQSWLNERKDRIREQRQERARE